MGTFPRNRLMSRTTGFQVTPMATKYFELEQDLNLMLAMQRFNYCLAKTSFFKY